MDYIIVTLETVVDPAKLSEAECWWIAYGKASGWPLTNISEGGGAYDAAEMRHRAARRARITREKEAQKERCVELIAAARAASLQRVANTRSMLERNKELAEVRSELQNTAHLGDAAVRCLLLFEQHIDGAYRGSPTHDIKARERAHYLVPSATPGCMACVCGYTELIVSGDAAKIAEAMNRLRTHVKNGDRT